MQIVKQRTLVAMHLRERGYYDACQKGIMKSVTDLLPEPPAGNKWWVTVLNSSDGTLGVTLARTKPYRVWGKTTINEKWTPAKARKALAWMMEEVE